MCKAKLALVWLGRSLPACHRADCHEMTCVRDAHIANTRQSPPPPPKQPDSRAQRRPKIVDNVSRRFHVCANTARARVRRAAVSARLTAAGGAAARLGARGAAASPCGSSPEARFGARCGAALVGSRRLPVSGRVRRAPLERAATLALSSPRSHPERCLGTALRRLRGRRRRGERETEGSGASSGFWPRGPAA